jgi:hypothetical protein
MLATNSHTRLCGTFSIETAENKKMKRLESRRHTSHAPPSTKAAIL